MLELCHQNSESYSLSNFDELHLFSARITMSKELEAMPWRRLPCSIKEVRLDITLKCGQSFRLKGQVIQTNIKAYLFCRWTCQQNKEFIGVLKSKVWILKQDTDCIYFKTFPTSDDKDGTDLHDYLNLDVRVLNLLLIKRLVVNLKRFQVKLKPLYKRWAESDPVFERISQTFSGVRILRQDPTENLFAFICSSNNNIQRYLNIATYY